MICKLIQYLLCAIRPKRKRTVVCVVSFSCVREELHDRAIRWVLEPMTFPIMHCLKKLSYRLIHCIVTPYSVNIPYRRVPNKVRLSQVQKVRRTVQHNRHQFVLVMWRSGCWLRHLELGWPAGSLHPSWYLFISSPKEDAKFAPAYIARPLPSVLVGFVAIPATKNAF